MTKHMDWLKVCAIIIFMMLIGGYYDRLNVETRTMILPLAIFIAATFFFVYLRKFQYEIRTSNVIAYKLVANEFSLIDGDGNERIFVSSDNAVITFYDNNHVPRATLSMLAEVPLLKLTAPEGSAELAFNQEGKTNLTLRDQADEIIWTAP
jgi:hypothetical protein